MSVELYDLGQRLRAALSGHPVRRAHYAPALPPTEPVAVTVEPTGHGLRLHAATTDATATAEGPAALAALTAVGVSDQADTHRTLLVPDRATLATLAALARKSGPGSPYAAPASVVAWWDQRGDHPGSGAVLVVPAVCAARWALGTAPTADREVSTWRRWASLPPAPDHASALLDLASLVTEGEALPGLDTMAEADARSWTFHRERVGAGWDWHRRDDRTQAALGLATRCDATELYDSLRLRDPLLAVRETFTGTVVAGTVTEHPKRGPLRVATPQDVCRLRPDSEVEGWPGRPQDAPRTPRGGTQLAATLTEVTVAADHGLVLTLSSPLVRRGTLHVGDPVVLLPKAVDPHHQQQGRSTLRGRYRTAENWLARRRMPPPRRRDVPLDVAIAAADD